MRSQTLIGGFLAIFYKKERLDQDQLPVHFMFITLFILKSRYEGSQKQQIYEATEFCEAVQQITRYFDL